MRKCPDCLFQEESRSHDIPLMFWDLRPEQPQYPVPCTIYETGIAERFRGVNRPIGRALTTLGNY